MKNKLLNLFHQRFSPLSVIFSDREIIIDNRKQLRGVILRFGYVERNEEKADHLYLHLYRDRKISDVLRTEQHKCIEYVIADPSFDPEELVKKIKKFLRREDING